MIPKIEEQHLESLRRTSAAIGAVLPTILIGPHLRDIEQLVERISGGHALVITKGEAVGIQDAFQSIYEMCVHFGHDETAAAAKALADRLRIDWRVGNEMSPQRGGVS